MNTIVKVIIGMALFVVLAIAAAIIIVPMVVDPNDYKPLITEEVKKATGRDLALEGELKLSVFPWLGVELGKTVLGPAPGFGPEPMVSLDQAQVRVKVLPLISRKVEVDTIVLEKPVIRLGVDKNGRTAWDDIMEKMESEAEPAEPKESSEGGPGVESVSIGGIRVENGLLVWEDKSQNTSLQVEDVNVSVDQLVPGEPVGVEASCRMRGSEPVLDATLAMKAVLTAKNDNQLVEADDASLKLSIDKFAQPDGTTLTGDIALSATAVADMAKSMASLSGLDLRLDLEGTALPSGSLAAGLQTPTAEVNWEQGTAQIPSFTFSGLGLTALGGMQATKLNTAPAINADLKLESFSPREVLKSLGQDILTQDSKALSSASADLKMTATENSVALPKLTAILDDTTLVGTMSVANFDAPSIIFDLNVDKLDADRYMPPEGSESSAPAEEKPAQQGEQTGEDPLKTLTLNGKATVGELKVMKVRIQDIDLTVTGKNGVFNVAPLTAKLYNGTFKATGKAALGQEIGPSDLKLNLSGMSIGDFLKDYTGGFGWIGGATSLNLDASTQGGADPTKTLDGAGDVIIKHGVLYGFTLLPGAVGSLVGGGTTDASKSKSTSFDQLGGSFAINKGQMDFKKLFMITEDGSTVESEGAKVNLVEEKLNVPLTMLSDKLPTVGGQKLDALPLSLTGSFDNPTLGVDPAALKDALAGKIKGQATKAVEDALGGALGGKAGETSGSTGGAENPAETIKKGLGGFLGGGKK